MRMDLGLLLPHRLHTDLLNPPGGAQIKRPVLEQFSASNEISDCGRAAFLLDGFWYLCFPHPTAAVMGRHI